MELLSPATKGFRMLSTAPCPDGRNSGGKRVNTRVGGEEEGELPPEESHCLSLPAHRPDGLGFGRRFPVW